MTITQFQYKRLKLFQRYLASNSYVTCYLGTAWLAWLCLLLLGLLAFFYVAPAVPAVGYFTVGACVATFLRDLRYFRDSFRMWPVTRQIFDQQKILAAIETYEQKRI
jgi:hypothetical protein